MPNKILYAIRNKKNGAFFAGYHRENDGTLVEDFWVTKYNLYDEIVATKKMANMDHPSLLEVVESPMQEPPRDWSR